MLSIAPDLPPISTPTTLVGVDVPGTTELPSPTQHRMTTSDHDDLPVSSHQPRSTGRGGEGEANVESIVDLDAIRGWSEFRDPGLRRDHELFALAELAQLDGDDRRVHTYRIHSPDVLIGRSHFRHPPVDLSFYHLFDHQRYRLGSPHAHLEYGNGAWLLRPLSRRCPTAVDGCFVEADDRPRRLEDGAMLTFGVTRFRFSTTDVSLRTWKRRRTELLDTADGPTVYLERCGAICGPSQPLHRQTPLVVGRSHPEPGTLPDTSNWPEEDDPFWDLAGVYDHERAFVAFRHVKFEFRDDRWWLCPLSSGHRTFVNRRLIGEPTELNAGDRIGLGSLLLRFYHPQQRDLAVRQTPRSELMDWSTGRTPSVSPPESPS